MKAAVFFPGIGYHCDKPLLYYSRKLAQECGYEETIALSYTYDGGNIRGNEEKMIFNIMLAVMTKFRNVCAHSDRLFDFRTKDALCDMKIHERLFLPREQGRYVYGKMTCSHS